MNVNKVMARTYSKLFCINPIRKERLGIFPESANSHTTTIICSFRLELLHLPVEISPVDPQSMIDSMVSSQQCVCSGRVQCCVGSP